MIKRAVRFATLMFAVSVPMWAGLQEPTPSQASALPGLDSLQATAASAMSTQSVWHVMSLSSR